MGHSGLDDHTMWRELAADCPAATDNLPLLLLLESDLVLSELGDVELHLSAFKQLNKLPSDLEINTRSRNSSASSSPMSSPTPITGTTQSLQNIVHWSSALASPERRPKRTGARARERLEIKMLRIQEQELRAKLTRLQHTPLAALVSSDSHGFATLAWKNAATTERERLTLSQHENAQLRARIAELKRLTKTLHRMLSHRAVKSAVRWRKAASWDSMKPCF